MLRRSIQKQKEEQPITSRVSANQSNSRELLHCVSLQNLRAVQEKKVIEQTFLKKKPTYVLGLNESSCSSLKKSITIDDNSLKNCRSNPDLLSFNNYIKLGNYEQQHIDKYMKTFRSSFEKSEVGPNSKHKDSRRIEANKREDKVHIKTGEKKSNNKIKLGSPYAKKPQRFIRKNAESVIISSGRDETGKSLYFSQRNLEEIAKKVNEESQQNEEELVKKIEELQKIKIQSEHHIQRLTTQLSFVKMNDTKKSHMIDSLKKEIQELTIQNQQLQKRIEQLCEQSNMILKDIEFNPAEFCNSNNISDASVIAFDMTETAEYLSNISDLEQELNKKNNEIFELSKMIEQMKIKEHCNKLKHQNEVEGVQGRWKQKYKGLQNRYNGIFEKYRSLRIQFAQLKQKERVRMKSGKKQQKVVEQSGNEMEKQSFFNLSMSMQQ